MSVCQHCSIFIKQIGGVIRKCLLLFTPWWRHHGNKWKHFPRYRWIPRTKASDVGVLMFSLICTWIDGWVNRRGDLRRHRARYDITAMPIHIWGSSRDWFASQLEGPTFVWSGTVEWSSSLQCVKDVGVMEPQLAPQITGNSIAYSTASSS